MRARIALGAAALALAGGAAFVLAGGDGEPRSRAASGVGGGRTVAVRRETLVQRETVDGTLGYAGSRTVVNRLAAGGGAEADAAASATVTGLPAAGSVVRRGGALFRLDGEPVVLLYGSTPAYRALATGVSDGRDVRQLERNLAALGFDPGEVDGSFDSATAAAVGDWQESIGLDRTGSVELGRVVFQPGARRVGELKTSVGGLVAAGAEVLETSSTERVVSIELQAELQSLAREGATAEVTLPDGTPVRGRIARVGRAARALDTGEETDPNAEPELVVDVTVRLRSERGLGRLDEAPVGVGLAERSRRNVLAVPVNALLARRGGGYGVELADGRIVAVEPGLFADGDVEVSGRGIRSGTRVVVPRA